MTEFELIPFEPSESVKRVQGLVHRSNGFLSVEFQVTIERGRICWPAHEHEFRADGLWRSTCFEVFLASASDQGGYDSDEYLELNFSPSGGWNAYEFRSYREGQRASEGAWAIEIATQTSDSSHKIQIQCRCDHRLMSRPQLRAGVSAVIEVRESTNSDQWRCHYYALGHRGGQPDFHDTNTFSLTV